MRTILGIAAQAGPDRFAGLPHCDFAPCLDGRRRVDRFFDANGHRILSVGDFVPRRHNHGFAYACRYHGLSHDPYLVSCHDNDHAQCHFHQTRYGLAPCDYRAVGTMNWV